MKANMGTTAKVIRLVVAAIIAVLFFTGIIPGTTAIILLIIAGIFILTSMVSFCPVYAILVIETCKNKINRK
jgi:hypothetical protein